MSTISQSIPNLLLGISQQPDNRKRPGQVRDAKNVFPDFALGMLKRPGGSFVTQLQGASSTGKYFPILRDQAEKYIAQYEPTNSSFNIWGLRDGIQRAVDMGTNTGVPATCNITGNGPVFSSLLTVVDGLGVASTTKTNGFDGSADLSDVNTTFCEASAVNTTLDITWGAGPFNVTYQRLEILVTALTNQIEFDGTTLDNSKFLNDWVQLDYVADGTGTFDNKTIRITPDAGQTARFAAIRIDGWKILKDSDSTWNYKTAVDDFIAAKTASDAAEADVLAKETLLAKAVDDLTPTTTSNLEFDWTAFSQPKRDSFGNYNRPIIHTGVVEYEGRGRQATAVATLTNTITDVGLSSSGSGYKSTPIVTIAGSGAGATAVANMVDSGVFAQVDLLTAGSNYDQRPIVSVGAGFADYNATALLNNAGQVGSVNLDGKVKITSTDVFYDFNQGTNNLGGAGNFASGTGSGTQGKFKLGENYIHFGRLQVNCGFTGCFTSDGFPRAVSTSNKSDLTDCSSVRIYAIAGNDTNGGAKPETASTDTNNDGTLRMRRLTLKFLSQDTEPTRADWDAQTEMFLVVDSEYSNLDVGTNPISPDVFCVGDATSGTISNNIAASGTDKLHAVNIAIPAQYQKANTWMRLEQKFHDSVQSAVAQDVFGVLSINPIPTTRTGTDAPLTITTNPLDPGTPVDATAIALTDKTVGSLTLTDPGANYNVGVATTITLSGGNPTVAAVPTITLTPTIDVVVTDKGKGYISAIAAVSGGGGSGAIATVEKLFDGVGSITVTGGDSNFISTPTILISAPNVSNPYPAGTLYIKDGNSLDLAANFVSVKNMSMGLTASTATDLATTTNGNGTGITVDLTVTAGQVTAASINTNGTGYLDGDELFIDGYPGVVLRVGGFAKGVERTWDHPDWSFREFRTWELQETFAPPANAEAAKTTAETNYNTATATQVVKALEFDQRKLFVDLQKSLCNITTVPSNAYLKDATVDDIELATFNDYTLILNKKKTVQLLATKTPNFVNHGVVVIQVAANSTSYGVTLTREGQSPDPFSITSAGSGANSSDIASSLASAVNANSNYTAFSSGPTIIIESTASFSLSTQGGTVTESLFGFTDTIANVSKLPLQCKDGYIVKIGNSADTTLDDMYVKFSTSGSATSGVGSWDEAPAPDIEFKFDPLTMPHSLISQGDGTFKVEPIDWKDRAVGDDDTNPVPKFVGHEITSVFFYRGRLGFLSGENVFLSQAQDIFNLWVETARTAVPSDPIDISAAGKQPVFLNYVAPTSVGLVLYSMTEQFLLSTDSDVLSPTTAKVNQLSSYECDDQIEAVSLGTSQAFISKTPLYTRLAELSDISSEQPPVKTDITDVIPELIPSGATSLVSSPTLSIVSIGEEGKSDIYQYRFLSTGRDERIVNSWYRWSLTGTLKSQFFDASTFYAVTANGTDVTVQSFDMTQSSQQGFLALPTGERTDVCLDLFKVNPFRSFNSTTGKTRFLVPQGEITGAEFVVVDLGGYAGDANTQSAQANGAVIKPTIETTASGVSFVDVTGDIRGHNVVTGYQYTMEIELPQLYRYDRQDKNVINDDVSSLILHRLKVKTGLSGPVEYEVSIRGKPDWDNVVSHTYPNEYELNNVNMQAKATHVVPVFQRNENLAVKIIGNTPFPVSLLGLDWEGKFNQRFYRRG